VPDTRWNPGFGARDSGLGTQEAPGQPHVDLDAAIDAVAREMTDVEPSASLRARVLDAIEQQQRRPALAFPRWAWAGAGTLVLALALATSIWMTRSAPEPGHAGTTVAEHSAPAPVRSAVAPPATAPGSDRGTAVAAATTAPDRRSAMVRAARLAAVPESRRASNAAARDEALVPALAEIAPLAFSQVDPSPLNVLGVEVTPLDIAPLVDIPSLEHGSAEDRSSEPRKENRP